MEQLTRYQALLKVRACFETEAAMAEYFGVSQPTVWRWLNQSKQIPVEGGHALRAETLGVVTKEQLRPDIYPVDHAPNPIWNGVDRRLQAGTGEDRPVSFPHNPAAAATARAKAQAA